MDSMPGYRTRLERAKETFAQLEREQAAFFGNAPYAVEKEVELGTGDTVYRAKVRRAIPVRLGMLVGETANHLRTGLDLMVAAMIRKAGGAKSKKSAFVISDSREKFEAELDKNTKGLPEAARDLIAAYKPYRGGDDGLWVIAKIDNEHKHHDNILAWGECTAVDMGAYMFGAMEDLIAKDGPEALAKFHELPIPKLELLLGETTRMRDGEELFRVSRAAGTNKRDDEVRYKVEILFAQGIIQEKRSAVTVLRELVARVGAIMDNFEAQGLVP